MRITSPSTRPASTTVPPRFPDMPWTRSSRVTVSVSPGRVAASPNPTLRGPFAGLPSFATTTVPRVKGLSRAYNTSFRARVCTAVTRVPDAVVTGAVLPRKGTSTPPRASAARAPLVIRTGRAFPLYHSFRLPLSASRCAATPVLARVAASATTVRSFPPSPANAASRLAPGGTSVVRPNSSVRRRVPASSTPRATAVPFGSFAARRADAGTSVPPIPSALRPALAASSPRRPSLLSRPASATNGGRIKSAARRPINQQEDFRIATALYILFPPGAAVYHVAKINAAAAPCRTIWHERWAVFRQPRR